MYISLKKARFSLISKVSKRFKVYYIEVLSINTLRIILRTIIKIVPS